MPKNVWPRQSECISFYGDPRVRGWLHANTVEVDCPWRLYYEKIPVEHILIHKKCAASLTRVLNVVWDRIGRDEMKIHRAHYDSFSGSYNLRYMRSGKALSMHAFACAIDFDAEHNGFGDTNPWFKSDSLLTLAFEAEGWTWGGRWNYPDSMHYQAARVY